MRRDYTYWQQSSKWLTGKMENCGKRETWLLKLFPEANLKYSEGAVSFAMKIRITLLLSVPCRCPIQLICILGRKMVIEVKVRVKEPQHSCLSAIPVVPQHVWRGADIEGWRSDVWLHFLTSGKQKPLRVLSLFWWIQVNANLAITFSGVWISYLAFNKNCNPRSWKAGINFPRASEHSQIQLDWYLRQIKEKK